MSGLPSKKVSNIQDQRHISWYFLFILEFLLLNYFWGIELS